MTMFQSLKRDNCLSNQKGFYHNDTANIVSIAQARQLPLQQPCFGREGWHQESFNRSSATIASPTTQKSLSIHFNNVRFNRSSATIASPTPNPDPWPIPPLPVSIAQARQLPLQRKGKAGEPDIAECFNRSSATIASPT